MAAASKTERKPYVSAEMLIAGASVLWAFSKPKSGEKLVIPSIDLMEAVPAVWRAMADVRAGRDPTGAERQRRFRANQKTARRR